MQSTSPAINSGSNQYYWDVVNNGVSLPFPGGADLSEAPLKIYVAKGTYKPLYNADDNGYIENGTRLNSFVMVKNGTTGYLNSCNEWVISITTTDQENAISGSTTATVWIEDDQPAQYVRRHYEITPSANAGSAADRVTLYFTQEDFDAFNGSNPANPLPAKPSDDAGNLIIEKRSGESSYGTGNPNTYPGAPVRCITASAGSIPTEASATAGSLLCQELRAPPMRIYLQRGRLSRDIPAFFCTLTRVNQPPTRNNPKASVIVPWTAITEA